MNLVLVMILALTTLLYGGFHVYVSAILSIALAGYLLYLIKKKGQFKFYLNDSIVALLLILVGYGITVIWAVDQGMAGFGAVKFFPVVLFALVWMQLEPEQGRSFYRAVPWIGAASVVLCGILQFIPV